MNTFKWEKDSLTCIKKTHDTKYKKKKIIFLAAGSFQTQLNELLY